MTVGVNLARTNELSPLDAVSDLEWANFFGLFVLSSLSPLSDFLAGESASEAEVKCLFISGSLGRYIIRIDAVAKLTRSQD